MIGYNMLQPNYPGCVSVIMNSLRLRIQTMYLNSGDWCQPPWSLQATSQIFRYFSLGWSQNWCRYPFQWIVCPTLVSWFINLVNYRWVWVKIRYPNNWMVNTKLDIHICGPINGLPFWPTSRYIYHKSCRARPPQEKKWVSKPINPSYIPP